VLRRIPPFVASRNPEGVPAVVLGSGVYEVDPRRPPIHFLLPYVSRQLPEGWEKGERARPQPDRHPLLVWMEALAGDLEELSGSSDLEGLKRALSPESLAMILIANDLYTLDRARKLQRVLLDRATNPDGFQGAAHEIAVSATMIRAGFDIDFEDESDGSVKHPELVATHYETGVRVAVEAKSVHRQGVLGFTGGKPPPEAESANPHKVVSQIYGQIERALPKAKPLPFIVFVDLNLPPRVVEVCAPALKPEFEEMLSEADPIYSHHGIRCGRVLNMLVVTNRPMNLGMPGGDDYHVQNLFLTPAQVDCRYPLGAHHITDIKDAVKLYGTVKVRP